jgi:aryl-alcohol dehydrogenase-like predicted oxidoreductase
MTEKQVVQYRVLGNTGERVSIIGVGGSHLSSSKVSRELAVRILREALDRGINFLDNSWDYGEGESEERAGRALQDGYREKAFLMTKIDGRSKKEATRQLNESLKRMRTDYIDLVQHHEIIRYDDANRIFDADGAQSALEEAREAGKVRYIGFTGHKDPHVHLHMLEVADAHDCTFDTVQLPLNVMDAHFRSFEKLVLPVLVSRGIGVLGMKSMGNGIILKSGAVTAEECLRYALTLPTSVVITGIDSMEMLEQAERIATTFKPLRPSEVTELLARTTDLASTGVFELFKTSTVFDATAQHPEWLGEEPSWVQELAAG